VENKTKKFTSLTRSSDFLHLKLHGKRFITANWLIISYLYNDSEKLRLGWTISRQVGNAVTRNKFKRWCREYFRLNLCGKDVVSGMDINVVFRPCSKDFYKKLSRKELEIHLDKFFRKIMGKAFSNYDKSND
jgi:ribonuclease P protein component